jgi:predicted GTPase
MADSKLCKDCQPKRKPPRLLTDKEIRNRITDGDLRRGLGEAILEKRKAALPLRRAKAMREHWQKVKTEPIRQLKKHIAQQVATYAKRFNKSKGLQDATKERNRWNYKEAQRVRNDLVERINRGEQFALDVRIEQFFRPTPLIRERIKE